MGWWPSANFHLHVPMARMCLIPSKSRENDSPSSVLEAQLKLSDLTPVGASQPVGKQLGFENQPA